MARRTRVAAKLSPGNTRISRRERVRELELVTAEELVLFLLWAVGAFEAANKQNRHPERDQNGQHTRVRADELGKSMHMPKWTALTSPALKVRQRDR